MNIMNANQKTNQKSLNDIMGFDHVVIINKDGSVSDGPNSICVPELWEDDLSSDEWELLSGFSGQDRYNGPIMHDSEYIGGGLEDYIIEKPGIYVAIVSNYFGEDDVDDAETEISGWAVARYIGP